MPQPVPPSGWSGARPPTNGESVAPGGRVALAGPRHRDPIMNPAFERLARRPLTPSAAVSKLRRGVQDNIAGVLESTGAADALGPDSSGRREVCHPSDRGPAADDQPCQDRDGAVPGRGQAVVAV